MTIKKMPGMGNKKTAKRTPEEVAAAKARAPKLIRYEFYDPERQRTVVRWGPQRPEPKHSDLGKPYVIGDNVDYVSTVTGDHITSKRQHRDELRAHDLVEVGNENLPEINAKKKAERDRDFKKQRVHDVVEAFDKAEAGYVDGPGIETADDSFSDVGTDNADFTRV